MPPSARPKLLILGWDAADWKIIDPLLQAGAMPALRSLIDRGLRADLSSLDPKLSPLLWTSIATGKTADKHGILNFVEPDATGLRISRSTSRRVKALWNILSQQGLRTAVIGWYATHPAEPIRGSVISNLVLEGIPAPDQPWPLAPGAVHPAAIADTIADLRMHPIEITPDDLAPLLPDLSGLNPSDPRIGLLRKLVAQCASIHNISTHLLAQPEWDCAMVFHEAIDVVGHHFMQYHPPRMPHVSEADFAAFNHVMFGIYQLQDMMLGSLLNIVGPDTNVILLSDHGFHSDHLRPRVQAAIDDPHAAMDATWHRPLGMLAMAGPSIARGASVHGANLLDITPTALTLLGQPIGADMDGRVLVEAFATPPAIDRVFGWDELDGDAGLHPADLRVDPAESRDALKQLAELGYIADAAGSAAEQAQRCDRETRFNLGVVYMTTFRPREATDVFAALHAEAPSEPRFAMNYAHGLFRTNRFAESVAVMEKIVADHPGLPDARLLQGAALFAQGRVEEAAAAFEEALRQSPDRPDLLCSLADASIHLKRLDQAAQLLDRARAIDPHDPAVRHKLALLALARGQFEPAAEHALEAVELRHFFPEAHYTLGVALTWLKDYQHAIQSFRVALSMNPGLIDAHRYIASIYRLLDDRASARPHRDAAERLLASASAGEVAPEALAREAPMGPQEWAKSLGLKAQDE